MGAGADGAGVGGAGVGTQITSPALAAAGFQKSTTGAVSSVKIDGATGDYECDEFGNEVGMSDAAQCVQIAFGTAYGTIASEPKRGVNWPSKLDDTTSARMYAEARRVMSPLQQSGIAELVSVRIETEGTALFGVVEWRDLRTGKVQPVKLPIG